MVTTCGLSLLWSDCVLLGQYFAVQLDGDSDAFDALVGGGSCCVRFVGETYVTCTFCRQLVRSGMRCRRGIAGGE